jgi:hypothetical protein
MKFSRQANSLLKKMEISQKDFQWVSLSCSRNEAICRLNILKKRFQISFKKLVFELHPDYTNNDPKKVEEFRCLMELKNHFDNLRILSVKEIKAKRILIATPCYPDESKYSSVDVSVKLTLVNPPGVYYPCAY